MTAASSRLVLGIESSCDETSVALLAPDGRVLSSVISSQIAAHRRYGGVVPEIAARAHLQNLPLLLDEGLSAAGASLGDVGAVAATAGPGLVGALLVGMVDTSGRAFLPMILREFFSPAVASSVGPTRAAILIYSVMAVVLAFRPSGLFPARG